MRILFAAVLTLALSACGQGQSDKGDAPAAAKAAAPQDYSAEDNAAAVAALAAPLNAADYENGRRVFAQCRSCHVIAAGARHGVGPNLHGVIGAETGAHAEGFAYSPAMRDAGLTWDAATLDRYLERPMALIPGTRMSFIGVRNPDDRRDVIAYIAVESQR